VTVNPPRIVMRHDPGRFGMAAPALSAEIMGREENPDTSHHGE
jgi:hypothetical protein